MQENQLKEYKIKTDFTEVIYEEHTVTNIVEAHSEEEAMEIVDEQLYKAHDEINDIVHCTWTQG